MARRKSDNTILLEKRWLTVAEAEKYLGFGNRATQQEWRDSGKLRYCQVERTIVYDKKDLDEFILKHKQ
mgnify:CR=1 FL=1